MTLDKKEGKLIALMFMQLINADAEAKAVFQRHKIADAIRLSNKHEQNALSALAILNQHGVPLTRDENGVYKLL